MNRWIFWQDLRNYSVSSFGSDFLGAIVVSFLAIPQSVAYSLLAGLPPSAGLLSAIFGTLFTSTLSSSRRLISGPSTAVAILIQTTIAATLQTYYPNVSGYEKTALTFHILLQIVIASGVIQILLSMLNVGKVLQFISRSVMLGYFTGVAMAILIQQLFIFFGMKSPDSEILIYKAAYLISHLHEMDFVPFFVGGISLILLLCFRKKIKAFGPILMMILISLFLWLLPLKNIEMLFFAGGISASISLPKIDLRLLQKIFPSAAAIAFLGILEVFSVTKALTGKNGERVCANQDVFSVGIANTLLSFFPNAMPSSASITRSLLGNEMGAKTRLCPIFSAFFVWSFSYFLWPFASYVPLVALSALLMVTVLSIIDRDQIKFCLRATKADAFVFLFTVFLCFIFTLDVAFIMGIVVSIVMYLRKAASPHLEEYAFNRAGRLTVVSPDDKSHRKVRIIGIGGELFFGVVDVLQNALHSMAEDPHVRVIVLRLHGVYHMDASMCYSILRFHNYLESTNRHLVISGLHENVWHIFYRSKLLKKVGSDNLFLSDEARPQLSTWKACLRAQEIIRDVL